LTFNLYTHFQHNIVPLHVASRHGQLQSISTLVKAGADLGSATKVGFILVFHQAQDDKKMLTFLLFCCDNIAQWAKSAKKKKSEGVRFC